jgi:hypothetical protein
MSHHHWHGGAAASAGAGTDTVALHNAASSIGYAIDAAAVSGRGAFEEILASFAADAEALDSGFASVTLANSQLWPGRLPHWVLQTWEPLKAALLAADEDWIVWTDWYEERLKGREAALALEIARATIPDETWKQGPRVVNGQIRRLYEERGIWRYTIENEADLQQRVMALSPKEMAVVGARVAMRGVAPSEVRPHRGTRCSRDDAPCQRSMDRSEEPAPFDATSWRCRSVPAGHEVKIANRSRCSVCRSRRGGKLSRPRDRQSCRRRDQDPS